MHSFGRNAPHEVTKHEDHRGCVDQDSKSHQHQLNREMPKNCLPFYHCPLPLPPRTFTGATRLRLSGQQACRTAFPRKAGLARMPQPLLIIVRQTRHRVEKQGHAAFRPEAA